MINKKASELKDGDMLKVICTDVFCDNANLSVGDVVEFGSYDPSDNTVSAKGIEGTWGRIGHEYIYWYME